MSNEEEHIGGFVFNPNPKVTTSPGLNPPQKDNSEGSKLAIGGSPQPDVLAIDEGAYILIEELRLKCKDALEMGHQAWERHEQRLGSLESSSRAQSEKTALLIEGLIREKVAREGLGRGLDSTIGSLLERIDRLEAGEAAHVREFEMVKEELEVERRERKAIQENQKTLFELVGKLQTLIEQNSEVEKDEPATPPQIQLELDLDPVPFSSSFHIWNESGIAQAVQGEDDHNSTEEEISHGGQEMEQREPNVEDADKMGTGNPKGGRDLPSTHEILPVPTTPTSSEARPTQNELREKFQIRDFKIVLDRIRASKPGKVHPVTDLRKSKRLQKTQAIKSKKKSAPNPNKSSNRRHRLLLQSTQGHGQQGAIEGGNGKRKYLCKCGRGYIRRSDLNRHIFNVTFKSEFQISKCPSCTSSFPSRDALMKHIITNHNRVAVALQRLQYPIKV